MSEKPEEPDFDKLEDELGLSPLDEDALQMNEMFHSLLRAGFRERQALILVGIITNEANESEFYYVKDDEEPEEEADSE
jgi:hypothetical protein